MAPEDSLFLLQVGFSYGRLGVSKLETYFKLFWNFKISSRQACGERGIGCSRSLPGLSFQLPHQGNDDDDDDDDGDDDDPGD